MDGRAGYLQAREHTKQSRRPQGLPIVVDDPRAIERLATVLARISPLEELCTRRRSWDVCGLLLKAMARSERQSTQPKKRRH